MSQSKNKSNQKKRILRFCYDIICPYAYLASLQIEHIAKQCHAELEFVPVLLGGIYQANRAPQGKDGSASQPMSDAKRKIIERDLLRMAWRNNVVAPLKGWDVIKKKRDHFRRVSLPAMRILSAAEGEDRRHLTHLFYSAFWQDGKDISEDTILRKIVMSYYKKETVSDHLMGYSKEASNKLREATEKAVLDGAFGVPTFFIQQSLTCQQQLVFGFDRLFLVARLLGRKDIIPLRLTNRPNTKTRLKKKLTFYYDFSSPWAFIANQRLQLLRKKYSLPTSKVDIELEYVPILLGALFKQLGTANAPLLGLSPNKQMYNSMDLTYWRECVQELQQRNHDTTQQVSAKVQWPNTFPIRTVLPLRCAIQQPNLRNLLYQAAWQQNRNIGDIVTLFQVLCTQISESEASKLIRECKENKQIKQILFQNTKRAYENGACGVPSFQVDDGEIIFGQDRLNVVEDLLNGWVDISDPASFSKCKL